MSSTDVRSEMSAVNPDAQPMNMRLEVVVVPVSDVDRAKQFYQSLGWHLDADYVGDDDFRIVQLTPPGSACSIIIGTRVTSATPGSMESLLLVVDDVEAATEELIARGVEMSEVFHDAGGVFHHVGDTDRVPGPDPARRAKRSLASFSDPDGNGWVLQEVPAR
ncbi:MAG TPA: VOC family protein [Solirubrobacteraceae bacterium]|nr:VOC family protein [Solirubrobacteraceae bacterium]